jgi:D-alanyl-lipoteichoic acid acyltransferase DltB (MBOAT superfamily)
LLGKNRKYTNIVAEGKKLPTLKEFFQMGLTFFLVVLGWIFFRAESMGDAWAYIGKIAQWDTIENLYRILDYKRIYIALLPMLMIEWFGRENQFGLEKLGLKWGKMLRYTFYFIITVVIIYFSIYFSCSGEAQEFIYFQF